MMDADEGVANMVHTSDYISRWDNSGVWSIPLELSIGTYIPPSQDGGIVIGGTFVKLILPRQYTQLSPAALGVRGDE